MKFKHGHSRNNSDRTPTYHSWYAMKRRCSSVNYYNYHNYGGRGIKVCERWNDFKNFLEDMGERVSGTTLDRIDVNGNYEPGNCRWADAKTQRANKQYNTKYKAS